MIARDYISSEFSHDLKNAVSLEEYKLVLARMNEYMTIEKDQVVMELHGTFGPSCQIREDEEDYQLPACTTSSRF